MGITKYEYQGKEIFPVVEIYHDIFPYLAGVKMKDFFLDGEKCALSWKIGMEKLNERFGDRLPPRNPTPAPLSYGHLICLGAPVRFPEDGEPNIAPFTASIDEAIAILKAKKGMDFAAVPLYQTYYKNWQYMKEQFPETDMPFTSFSVQGPLTSAVLMRGQDLLCDVYDEPEKVKEFILLMTDSIIDYTKHLRRVNKQPENEGWGTCDDFASLFAPHQWPEFVIPAWNLYFEKLCGPKNRFLHVENLTPKHLPYLGMANITHYQPSVSDMITIADVKKYLPEGIPFDWLLYAFHITEMSDEQIQVWVDETAAAGVSRIRTQCGAFTAMQNKFDRIEAFFKAFEKYKV